MRTYTVRRTKLEGKKRLLVTCPQPDCGGQFVVLPRSWTEGRRAATNYNTRMCPYCFSAAKKPKQFVLAKDTDL